MANRVPGAAVVFASVLFAGGALAAPPGPGQHFDCSDGGTSSCATDDQGCVPADTVALKCSSTAAKIVAKAVKGATGCHAKQAQQRFQGTSITGAGNSEENCENNPGNSVESNFDAGLAKLASLNCSPAIIAGVTSVGATLFGTGPGSFDGDNGNVYCDSSSGALIGDDDAGSVAATAGMLKCEIGVAKALVKLQATASKCHTKMAKYFLVGRDFPEEDCEEISALGRGGLAKFNSIRDKLVASGTCPPCLGASAMDSLAASVLATEDGNGDVYFPCP